MLKWTEPFSSISRFLGNLMIVFGPDVIKLIYRNDKGCYYSWESELNTEFCCYD